MEQQKWSVEKYIQSLRTDLPLPFAFADDLRTRLDSLEDNAYEIKGFTNVEPAQSIAKVMFWIAQQSEWQSYTNIIAEGSNSVRLLIFEVPGYDQSIEISLNQNTVSIEPTDEQ